MGSLEGPLFQERSDARTSFERQLNVIPHQPHSVRLQNVCSDQARKPNSLCIPYLVREGKMFRGALLGVFSVRKVHQFERKTVGKGRCRSNVVWRRY
ncbi:hypothetical protein NPIL_188031 [Nephila pilipes]|uniref:Uncharacterized protein n=1 Tax=Nephila pilipes TaxID=299642 RepID=A0A8X6QAI9_NEPPI|nr:hypothetical protein NPIL_188031 [Nephila pilipes]